MLASDVMVVQADEFVTVAALQGEIQRQAEMFRALDEPHEPPFSSSRQYFANLDTPPVSPRQLAQDDARRTLAVPQPRAQANYNRPLVPSNLSVSTRRPYGSFGASTTQSSPSSLRTATLIPPPPRAPRRPGGAE